MSFTRDEITDIYRKRARNYDLSANLYYLLGFREFAYRKRAVQSLNLQRGDVVVDLCCGTGLNFSLLRGVVGEEGRIIGVDLTPEMLNEAKKRIKRNKWDNIELVQSDAAKYEFPRNVDGIISTFGITLVPDYDAVIRRGADALTRGKRFVVLDFKMPDNWPQWLVRVFVIITMPFGVTLDLAERHPWESIDRYLIPMGFEELYFGGLYLSIGEAP